MLILGSRLVGAQPLKPQQQYDAGGGIITGAVYGFDMFDELEPIAWATVYASSPQYKFTSYTSGGGVYQMFVPQGTYNVTVVQPGYVPQGSIVAVSAGSANTINFYLEESHVPVPEFPSGMVSAIAVLAFAAVLVAVKRNKRKK
jgi:hypothetical protein